MGDYYQVVVFPDLLASEVMRARDSICEWLWAQRVVEREPISLPYHREQKRGWFEAWYRSRGEQFAESDIERMLDEGEARSRARRAYMPDEGALAFVEEVERLGRLHVGGYPAISSAMEVVAERRFHGPSDGELVPSCPRCSQAGPAQTWHGDALGDAVSAWEKAGSAARVPGVPRSKRRDRVALRASGDLRAARIALRQLAAALAGVRVEARGARAEPCAPRPGPDLSRKGGAQRSALA